MVGWRGPQARLEKIFIIGLTSVLLLPFLLGILWRDPDPLAVLVTVLIPIGMGTLHWALLKISADFRDMVFRDSWLPVHELGKVIKKALEESGIPYERPLTRPPSTNGLYTWIEWEVKIPDEDMRIAVMRGGLQGSLVFVGPVTEYNTNEVERLKRPIDTALRDARGSHAKPPARS